MAVLLLLSGCVQPGGGHVSLVRDGDRTSFSDDASADCGDAATLSVAVQVQAGSVRVRVFDGDGAEVFSQTYEAPDGGEAQRSLFGAPGPWRLEVDSGGFEGRVSADLRC